MSEIDELLDRALEHHRNSRFSEAAADYRAVLRANPEQADGLYLYGCLAQQTGNYVAARDLISRAVTLAPGQTEYLHALSLACYRLGCEENGRAEYVAARDSFAKALELKPDWLEARHNLARALYELGQVGAAFAEFKRCSEMEAEGSAQSRAMMAVIVPGVPEVDNSGILATRRAWAERDLPQATTDKSRRVRTGRRRVGYVSSFFQRDNWMKPVWGLINQHDRNAFEVHVFSDCAASEVRHGYRAHSEDRWFDTSELSNDDTAAVIDKCGIDVLVDLNGYSNMRRLPMFARRLAPVVIGWFNMYATSGMSGFDYLIGDSEVVPASEEQFYSEKILRVSGSYLAFEVSYPVPPIVARSADCGVVFGALASQYKITDEVVGTWARILSGCGGSSLLVKNTRLGSEAVRADLISRFSRFGVSSGRVQLEGPSEHFEFLRAYERIDVALDTFPYNGGTTTTEAIWQGVPVISFYGDRWASRTSASILRASGLGEFVAESLEGYVEFAIRSGREVGRIRDIRMGMRESLAASEVCDVRRFARAVEGLYRACD